MTRTLSLTFCGVLVMAAAVVHGASTHRWAAFQPNPERITAFHAYAVSLADYTSKEIPSELPVKERSSVSCRHYTSPSGLPSVLVSVTSGPPGAVSTHTPDVCYPGSGYKIVMGPKKESIDLPGGGTATYLVADFEKKSATSSDRQRVRWSWTTNGVWDVPNRPRFAYLREPLLLKIYLVTTLSPGALDRTDFDPPAVQSFVATTFAQYSRLLAGK
jgi:hypothetical protein